MNAQSKNVVLVMGGDSAEREVSLSSGRAVHQALIELGHRVTAADGFNALRKALQADPQALVFNILHGSIGENGVLAGWLEAEGHAFTGTTQAGAVMSWYKDVAKLQAQSLGLLTPPGQCVADIKELQPLDPPGPWIVKPADEGSSVDLFLLDAPEQVQAEVARLTQSGRRVLIEQCIRGMECTVGLVNGQVLPVVRIEPAGELYDYEAKYNSQSTRYHCPSGLDAEVELGLQEDAQHIFSGLKLTGWGRVDFIVDAQGRRWFLEANTTPGMTATSLVPKAAQQHGWTFKQLVAEILATAGDGA